MSRTRPTDQRPSPRPRPQGGNGSEDENSGQSERDTEAATDSTDTTETAAGTDSGEVGGTDTAETSDSADSADTAETSAEESGAGSGAARRSLPGPRALLAALLVAAVLGGTGYLAWEYFSLRSQEASRTQAVDAAGRFAAELSSYDFNRLQENFSGVTANATPRFAQQYEQVGSKLTELIKKHQAVSKGEVVASGVQSFEAERAVVVLFVDQTITNTNSPQPRIDRNRMRMTLVRQDDRWLVDDVALL
ncbi:VirB8 protein [Saccharomonospora marina XMU15]|uniref:VirB8 protein n=1 Tax=Saccharomonospora marina XMU15 TaxID=882083 RepID=H5X5R1_9PSEU|nr:VirB8/TrbF family protein [Saccharomonospora marina]EHR51209.1 VirB8 protein [Saccharomonospora marina XMU15]